MFGDAILGRPACFTGLITRRNKRKTTLFLDLVDGTGKIQALLPRGESETLWEAAIGFSERSRVAITGRVVRSATGQTSVEISSITEHPVSAGARGARRGGSLGADVAEERPPTALYLARLENHFRHAIQEHGFTEVSMRLISASSPVGGVEPLRVIYDGYGSAFFLAPSPVPQLVREIIDTPYDRLFSVSRCITQTYRDPHVSVESVILAGVASDLDITTVLALCHELAADLYQSDRTAPIRDLAGALSQSSLPWPPPVEYSVVDKPELQLFDRTVDGDDSRSTRLGRLCWPFETSDEYLHAEYVLAEGYTELSEGEPTLTGFVVNVERLLHMLLDGTDIRQIPTLGSGNTDES